TSDSLDNLTTYVALLTLAAAIAVAWRQARGAMLAGDPPPAAHLAVLWIATSMFLQYFPRMDYAHLVGAVPLIYVVGAGLLGRARWALASAVSLRVAPPLFTGACIAVTLFVVATKTAPKVYSQVMLARDDGSLRLISTPSENVHFERADLYFP